jgi:hypothetical protein
MILSFGSPSLVDQLRILYCVSGGAGRSWAITVAFKSTTAINSDDNLEKETERRGRYRVCGFISWMMRMRRPLPERDLTAELMIEKGLNEVNPLYCLVERNIVKTLQSCRDQRELNIGCVGVRPEPPFFTEINAGGRKLTLRHPLSSGAKIHFEIDSSYFDID